MIKRRQDRSDIGEIPVPLTMMDLAWLVTIVTLCAAQFGIGNVRLPQLCAVERTRPSSVASKGIEVFIATDGELRLQGEPILLDDVGARVKALGDPRRTLMLSIETKADGTGHTDRLVQLVDRLQREHIENPLEVRAKLQSNTTAPHS